MIVENVTPALVEYVEREILPRYAAFDAAHRRDHATAVVERSLRLAHHYDVSTDMVYAVAAYHDVGLAEGREQHHTASAAIVRADAALRQWFTEGQIEIMADAAEDHRASSGHEPRTIYGKIVAEADRLIDAATVVQRTVQYGLSHYPQLAREAQYERFVQHLQEKYSDTGYVRLWLSESDNAANLELLREIIRDERRMRAAFDSAYAECAVQTK